MTCDAKIVVRGHRRQPLRPRGQARRAGRRREGSPRLARKPARGQSARADGRGPQALIGSPEEGAAASPRAGRSASRREKGRRGENAKAAAAAIKMAATSRPVYIDEAVARFSHAVTTDRPFLERITQFWSNHFAVSVDKIAVLGLAGAMEREAIRPNVTGSFTRMLLAVEKHPGDAAVPRQPDLDRAEFARREIARKTRQVRRAAKSTSTKTWRAKSSSCIRWASTAATRRPMSPPSPRPSPAGRSAVSRRAGGSRGSASTRASRANSFSARSSTSRVRNACWARATAKTACARARPSSRISRCGPRPRGTSRPSSRVISSPTIRRRR